MRKQEDACTAGEYIKARCAHYAELIGAGSFELLGHALAFDFLALEQKISASGQDKSTAWQEFSFELYALLADLPAERCAEVMTAFFVLMSQIWSEERREQSLQAAHKFFLQHTPSVFSVLEHGELK